MKKPEPTGFEGADEKTLLCALGVAERTIANLKDERDALRAEVNRLTASIATEKCLRKDSDDLREDALAEVERLKVFEASAWHLKNEVEQLRARLATLEAAGMEANCLIADHLQDCESPCLEKAQDILRKALDSKETR